MYYLQNSYKQMQADINGSATVICPEKIYLDITEDCNLHCTMCRDKVEMLGKTMPMELFKSLVDETSPYCKSYSLFIWGEPLVLNDFRERVQYVHAHKRADCNVEISTNGMLLDDNMIRFLRRYEVRVIVSFDGANKSTFENIRTGAHFERVCKNVKTLNQAYEDTLLDIAPATYTSVQRNNQKELSGIVKTVSNLGFRRIGFGLVTAPANYAPCFDEHLCRDLNDAYLSAEREKMFIELYPTKVGDYVYWGNEYVPLENFVVGTRCDAPLCNAVIRYDGEVCLCCNFGASVGNVTNKSFLEIWKSQKYDELREAVNDHDAMPNPCRGCWWVNRLEVSE
ncbi:MAG: radical SAM protein [Oscillospiraceae bacterium]|nr:radical SAM protein [Oscillospiraceae bacterium]